MSAVSAAFSYLLNVSNLLYINLGLFIGIVFGSIPGLSATTGICLLLPITFNMDTVPAMLLLLGLYCGGVYGGSITAILIKTPGAVGSAMTVLDGHTLAENGHPGKALDTALKASTFGGVVSALILIFCAPTVANYALKFGSQEKFALAMFGLAVVSSMNMKYQFKGIVAAMLGIFISCIGTDPIEGVPRFTFGTTQMLSGINIMPALIGMFAISEILRKTQMKDEKIRSLSKEALKETFTLKEFMSCLKDMIKSTLIGTVVGAIPGTGTATAATLCYAEAQRSSKTPEKFGTGHINGIAAPEAGNNGVTGATLIPTLTLGIPGDTATAVLLGALMMQGITPGPSVFKLQAPLMYTIMIGMLVINVFMFMQGKVLIRAFVNIVRIPSTLLNTLIITTCVIGAFSVNNQTYDVVVMLVFAVLGYVMNKIKMPTSPMIMGILLGEMAESNLRRSLTLSGGSWLTLFSKPISAFFISISILIITVNLGRLIASKLKDNRKVKAE